MRAHTQVPFFCFLILRLFYGNYFAYWVVFMILSSTDFFKKKFFSKSCFKNTVRVQNGLDPDQDRHSFGPDLGPNCLQRSSLDSKIFH